MKKRFFAIICVLATLISGVAFGLTANADTVDDHYQVGYAIKNINPWVSSNFDLKTDLGSAVFVDPSTPDKKIYPSLCSLVGNQVDWSSVIANVFDDNGDGERNEEDGIFITCTAVSYGKGTAEEKTVLFFTMDAMKTYTEITSDVRKRIVEQYGEAYGIAADQIMVSSNHSHSSPQYTASLGSYIDTATFDTTEKVTKLKADRKTYYNWVVDQMVAAAKESLDDRAAATMTRGSVDATEATADLGYNNGEGYQMNAIRHYEKTVANKLFTSQKVSYISSNATPSASKLKEGLQASSNSYNNFSQGSVVTNLSDESDNNMYVLRFEFDANSGKEPVVFVNWRAHSTMNSSVERTSISSDYANGLRTVLADKGYRAAFFLGAAGNVVAGPTSAVYTENGKLVPKKMDWLYEATTGSGSSLKVNSARKTFIYGKMLAEIADYCMDEENALMTETLPAGEIKNLQLSWQGDKQIYTDELKAAALALREKIEADMAAASSTSSFAKYLSDNSSKYFPYRYTDPNTGKLAILNTRLHYNSVYNQAVSTSTATKASAIELNAIMLGENVAFVTSPNELADYYHDFSDIVKEDGTADMLTGAEIEALNDWYNLISESYGMPFVLGYSNQNVGYIANWLDHYSNSELFYQITGKGKQGYMVYSPGTYESLTSSYAQGQGEVLVKLYKKMLNVLKDGYRTSYCEACKETVEWSPILETSASQLQLGTGHYYLYDDLPVGSTGSNRFSVKGTDKLCLDLNGHKVETASRSFYIDSKGTVNLFDSVGTGEMISYSGGNNVGGGAIYLSSTGTFNMYGGTIRFVKAQIAEGRYQTGNGGVIATSGTINMYGGTMIGGELAMSSYYSSTSTSNGRGAAVYLSGKGQLNISGGRIIAGKAVDGRYGDCVYLDGSNAKVNLSGDAQVDEIYLSAKTGKQVVIKGKYTGRAAINASGSPEAGIKLGTLSSADISNATLTYTGNGKYVLTANKNTLVTSARTDGAVVVLVDYTAKVYEDLSDALSHADGGFVTLLKPVASAITVAEDAYLDLNGNSITGKLNVLDGKVLYCMDSETDDYTVADGKYGRLTDVTGTVSAISEDSTLAVDGYLMVTEQDGASFHRVNLQLTAMSLRAESAGLYYKSDFGGDEVVARNVDRFGVALSIKEVPTAENLKTACAYSWFDGFAGGLNANAGDNTSTILEGVLKSSNSDEINSRNAELPIYGRAYIKLSDGSYLFGASASRTFRQQLEDVNDAWSSYSTAQKKAAVQMCNAYLSIVKSWEIDTILSYGAKNDDTLKILAIGNSYAVDSMHLLYEVYKAENPEKQVVLGYAYKSGCTLAEHVEYMTSGEAVYTYYEVGADGARTTTYNVTLESMMLDENWDVVTLQQGSSESGLADTYSSDIAELCNYAKTTLGYAPTYGWNMTWSYPVRTDSNAEGFDQYGSQEAMFEMIVDAVKTNIVTNASFKYLMPVGLAVQNARTYYTARKDIHRDAYGHLNDFSRLMAAYVWYCELEDVTLEEIKMDTVPAALTKSYTEGDMALTDVQKQVLIQSVNNAITTKDDGSFAVTQVTIAE